ncbi:uncharacterized protein EV154DRAFT_478346 [Mucor mucedo]|uniref:uncharacterized protein n=1 Tax=Mucor mucedo TaxID=29922 RepID=UPI002220DF36|nr:uncharacterized protein EV154DRAFT_478346 [Mucor mucedo]KAI7894368.1 hypothetical protein EV154DRAFT_478346 [Mucor mucedo]
MKVSFNQHLGIYITCSALWNNYSEKADRVYKLKKKCVQGSIAIFVSPTKAIRIGAIITCFSASIATTGQYFGTSINSNLKRAKESKLAIVCNSSDGNILYQGDSADEEWKLQENRENNVYVRNVFLELGMNFLNTQDGESNKNDIHHKAAVQGIIRALEEEIEHWEKKLNSSRTQFQYVFNVPTHWDYAIREELIRPIFIQAAFIDKHDHGRLIFFTRLESTFRFIQSEDKSFEKTYLQLDTLHLRQSKITMFHKH